MKGLWLCQEKSVTSGHWNRIKYCRSFKNMICRCVEYILLIALKPRFASH
jgi:hypothetical protein